MSPPGAPPPRCCRCSRPKFSSDRLSVSSPQNSPQHRTCTVHQLLPGYLHKRAFRTPTKGAQFERELLRQVGGEVPPDDHFKRAVHDEMASQRKRGAEVLLDEEEKENVGPAAKFRYSVPPNDWVYQTPPNRKLNFRGLKDVGESIRPAVLERRGDGENVVYELSKGARVNLSSFEGMKEVDIDGRFLVEVKDDDKTESSNEMDHFQLERHFLGLTCRPKKVLHPLHVSRTSLRPKRDIFEPQPGCSKDQDDHVRFLDNFNFSDNMEQSFNFRFSSDNNRNNLFDFEGNEDEFRFHF